MSEQTKPMTPVFDQLEAMVKRARQAINAEQEARAAETLARTAGQQVRVAVTNHYDQKDAVAGAIAALAEPTIAAAREQHATAAYCEVVIKRRAELDQIVRDIAHLVPMAKMEMVGVSRRLHALVEED